MSENQSRSFELLHPQIQRWIWQQEWNELRAVQEEAIPLILAQKSDVVISAATASGKTEAAFLPILTTMLEREDDCGLVVYVSPLTALINDQFSRLTALCENLRIQVWPWHGGISASIKKKFFQKPQGIVLITPESLQALFCNHGSEIKKIFAGLRYLVVDELHSFIGSERGKQLQSLLHLIEFEIRRRVPRIGLSATLGNMELAAEFLRGNGHCEIIKAGGENNQVKILLKGIIQQANRDNTSDADEMEKVLSTIHAVTEHLYRTLRGSNNLVFPNSKSNVELYSHHLARMCERNKVPNEFYPHHGSLSKEIREDAERSLKSNEHSTTVICTNTLELGIDIGAVKNIVQIGSPPSVASLRQRLGRSGRRKGEAAILRGFTIEQELTGQAGILTELRAGTFQICAMIELLLEGWCESPRPGAMHLSTLVQQIIAIIAQHGGSTIEESFHLLCEIGPFATVQKTDYLNLLRTLAEKKIIEQDRTGLLLHGEKGEKIVNHYSFYASFAADEEYRVIAGSKTLGTIPIQNSLKAGGFILFAGKTWRVNGIDDDTRVIHVTLHKTGAPPIFTPHGGYIDTVVRQRMKKIYSDKSDIRFADPTAKGLIEEGRFHFSRNQLQEKNLIQRGSDVYLFTWLGDTANEAIALMLRYQKLSPFPHGPIIEFFSEDVTAGQVRDAILELRANPRPSIEDLLAESKNLRREKWDWTLPNFLLQKSYASLHLALDEAWEWIQNFK